MNESDPSPVVSAPALSREQAPASSRVVLAAVLCLVYLLVRGQGLMALPIFSDEAIYLRWAQLVRAGHGWVSLIDPKPPLHFWLMAAAWGWAKDPLMAARGLSLLSGLIGIPAVMLVCDEVGLLHPERPAAASGRVLGLVAALLMIFCPFLAFYQRLATADALFVAEMLLGVWLGLRWSRRVVSGLRAWPTAIALGATMGAAMMTRQGLSYTLWGIPLVGVALHLRRDLSPRRWVILAAQFLLAAALAGVLWLPYLTHDLAGFAASAREDTPARAAEISEWTVLKQRVLYQDHFTQRQTSRLALAAHNAELASEWFWTYLTWPVCLMSAAGLLALALRRQWRVLILLAACGAFTLGPVIILGTVLYSRYVLAGAPVILIAAAYGVVELLSLLVSERRSPVLTWSAAIVLLIGVLVLPLHQVGLQATKWWQQSMTVADRAQYITGWTSGLATQKALAFVKGYAAQGGGKVVLITDDGWGIPADAAWVSLEGLPNLDIYYKRGASESPLLTPVPSGEANCFLLRRDKWLYTPPVPVTLPAGASVLYLTKCFGSDRELLESLRRWTPNLKPVLSFYGIDSGPDHPEHVVLYEVQ